MFIQTPPSSAGTSGPNGLDQLDSSTARQLERKLGGDPEEPVHLCIKPMKLARTVFVDIRLHRYTARWPRLYLSCIQYFARFITLQSTHPQRRCVPLRLSSAMSHGIEESKRAAAIQAVKENFPPDPRFVGIGSGTTIVYVVEAINALEQDVSRVCFVPTGYQSRQLILDAGLIAIQFDSIPEKAVLDICFDGADEVDEDLNCIKGGGACLFQEKLVAMRSKKFICVADHRKLQSRLLTSWPSIPIEVAPIAARQVLVRLRELGSPSPHLRAGHIPKAGPLKTDQDFFIIDAPFPRLLTSSDLKSTSTSIPRNTDSDSDNDSRPEGRGRDGLWEVEHLANAIKSIEGVLEVGIFSGRTGPEAIEAGTVGGQRPVACYFGMADGSVTVRKATPKLDEIKRTLEFEAKPAD